MEATAIVGIVVAGVVGPTLGYVAAWLSDKRKFRHERELKASDDLVALLDDVQIAIDRLWAACNDLTVGFTILSKVGFDGLDAEKFDPRFATALRADQDARALVARLRMRPHADPELVSRAEAAEGLLQDALNHMRFARAVVGVGAPTEEATERLSDVPDLLKRARQEVRAYEALARDAVGKLIGSEVPNVRRRPGVQPKEKRHVEPPRDEAPGG